MSTIRFKTIIPTLIAGLFLLANLCWLPPQAGAQDQRPGQDQDRYCIWLFWTKDPAVVKRALERLAQGDPFMVVARDLAREYPKTSQANADCMPARGMDPAVLAVAKNLQIGELSRPFDLSGGTALVMRTTDAYRRKAQQLYAKGRFAQAERELLRDLKLHPASASAWHMLSLTRTAQGNYKDALNAVDKALSLTPNNPAMLNDKASALANLGRAKQAVPVFEKAMERDPENPTIMSNLAWALTLAQKDPKRALTLAKKACKTAPREARVWHTLAKVQAAQGLHADAVISLRQALTLAPKDKAASQDLVASIMALNPKVLARLNQDCAPAPATSLAKPKPVEKSGASLPQGLKPAPNLAGPGISLPESWPSLPVAAEKGKPKPGSVAKAGSQAEAKAERKPPAKPEQKAPAPAKPPAFTGKRIVSLPMPNFQEQSKQTALPKAGGQGKAQKPGTKAESQPEQAQQAKTAELKEETKTGSDQVQAKSGKPEPETEKPVSEPAKPEANPEPGKDQSKSGPGGQPAKPATAQKSEQKEPAPVQPKSEPKLEQAGETAPKPADKVETKNPPSEPELAKSEAKTESAKVKPAVKPEALKESAPTAEKPHYLIQVASYRPEALAKKELRSWQNRKMTGFIEKWTDRRDRIWHRVLLGPFPTQKAAEETARQLKAKRLVRDYYVVKRPSD